MQAADLILSREEAAEVSIILNSPNSHIARTDLLMKSGARVVLFGGGHTVAVYAPKNKVPATGPGVLSSDENHLSPRDFARAYDVSLVNGDNSGDMD